VVLNWQRQALSGAIRVQISVASELEINLKLIALDRRRVLSARIYIQI